MADDDLALRSPLGAPPVDPLLAPTPTAGDVIGAAVRQDNPIASVFRSIAGASGDIDPSFDPMSEPGFKGSVYEQRYLDRFIGVANRDAYNAIVGRIEQENRDRETLHAAGGWGMAASLAAGLLDPTIFVPIGGAVKAVEGGYSLARTAARIGGLSGLQASVSELALQASQLTRTPEEGAFNIATGTILGALLGGGAAAMLNRVERQALETALEGDRVHLGGVGFDSSAGAAAADTRQLTLASFTPDWIKQFVPPSWQEKAGDYLLSTSPTLRIFRSGNVEAKRAMADLAETALRFEDNAAGITTSRYGTTVDRLVRSTKSDLLLQADDALKSSFAAYRGLEGQRAPQMRALVQDINGSPDGKLSYSDFKAEVTRALMNGDASDIPEVANAAKAVRSKVLAPTEKWLKEIGLLDPDKDGVRGDPTWFARLWSRERVAAGRDKAKAIFTDWLSEQQTTKAAAKDRLSEMWARKQEIDAELKKLDAVLARLDVRDAKLSGALSEAERSAERAKGRAEGAAESAAQQPVASAVDVVDLVNIVEKAVVTPESRERLRELAREARDLVKRETKLKEAAAGAKTAEDRAEVLRDQTVLYDIKRDITNEAVALAEKEADDLRVRMEKELRDWKGDSAADAVSALRARDKADAGRAEGAPRLRAADPAVDRAVKRILDSDRDLTPAELGSRADEMIDRILSGPDGRLAYDAASGGPRLGAPSDQPLPRGSLAARDFAIPTERVWDFVEHDAEHLLDRVLSTVLSDGMIHERFGDVDMTQAFRRLNEDAARRAAAAKTDAERTAIEKERASNIEDLAATRDRIRGVYGFSPDPMQRRAGTWARRAALYNTVTDLGTAALNSMGDMAGVIFRYGLGSTFRDGWAPMLRSMVGADKEFKGAALRQAKAAQIAVETALNLRNHALTDVLDHYQPGSKFDRGLRWAADKSQLVNGQAWFTDTVKTVASTVVAADILRAAERVAAGTATEKEIANLAARNISRADADAIWKQFSNGGGDKINGVRIANTADWTDGRLRQVFEGALARETDIAVVTPGAEKALWMSRPVAGLLGQFKSFVAATHERTLLAQMQQRDGRTLAGLVSALALGVLSYRFYTLVSGQPFETDPSQIVKEGLSRSGVTGWMDEINSIASKATRGQVDMYRAIGANKPLSRYASRSVLASFLGPTAGKIEGLATGTGAVFSGDFSGGDTSRLRRLVPFQNLFYVRGLLNEAEEGFNDLFGIPQKQQPLSAKSPI